MRRLYTFAIAALAALTVACGAANPLTATAPSAITADGSGNGTLTARQFTPGVNSCPDGELVSGIDVNVNQGGTAIIQWIAVGSIHEYTLRVVRYQTGEQVAAFGVRNHELAKVGPFSDGTYRAYVSYQNACGGYGPPGSGVVFTIDKTGQASGAVVIYDGDDNSGGGGIDGDTPPSDDDLPTGPPSDPGGGGDNGGGGGDLPSCHVHPNANDHGTPSGDQNSDGHHDCGIGNTH